MEYSRCTNESETKYEDYFKIIQKILNKNGQYFITCLHLEKNTFDHYTLYDCIKCYFLAFGNDGCYPKGRFALTKHAKNAKLKNIFQIERTNEYYLTSIFYLASYRFVDKSNNVVTYLGLMDAIIKTIADPYYIHTYLCYTPTPDFNWCPWLWQFIPSQRGNWFGQFVTLEYILFQNME